MVKDVGGVSSTACVVGDVGCKLGTVKGKAISCEGNDGQGDKAYKVAGCFLRHATGEV